MIGSLCSGYGGLDLAVIEATGLPVAWHIENDPAPSRVLHTHWPNVPNYHDVTAVQWSTVPPVDVITAGYPCQPFSLAGRRKGTDDERHLWPHIAEAIRRIRPGLVILENVPGHRSLGFGAVLGDLASIGYDAQWQSVCASDVGAPHGRERVFIAASDTGSEAGRLRPGLCASDPGRLRWGRLNNDPATATPDANGTGLERRHIGRDSADQRATRPPSVDVAPDANGLRLRGWPPNPERRKPTTPGDSARPIAWGIYGPAIRRWETTLGRPAPPPTDIGPRGGHRLSPRFVEWMNGLPDGWVTDVAGLNRRQQIATLGRGVVPLQALAALRHLLQAQTVKSELEITT